MKKKNTLTTRPSGLDSDTGISVRDFKPRKTPGQWLNDRISYFSFSGDTLLKALTCGALLIFFSLLQTTILARLRPFGAVPDLILPLVCAVAISEREKWGAVFGIIAAFVIESLGGSFFTILPLLYMPVGYVCGILSTYYIRDSFTVRALIVASTSLVRALFTLFTVLSTVGGVTVLSALTKATLPELGANLLIGLIPHYFAKLCLRPFNKTREEKVK